MVTVNDALYLYGRVQIFSDSICYYSVSDAPKDIYSIKGKVYGYSEIVGAKWLRHLYHVHQRQI